MPRTYGEKRDLSERRSIAARQLESDELGPCSDDEDIEGMDSSRKYCCPSQVSFDDDQKALSLSKGLNEHHEAREFSVLVPFCQKNQR